MSKELTQKLVEAGVVPTQAVRQLKTWRQLSDDVPESSEVRRQMDSVVGDIRSLLEQEGEMPELRETVPGLDSVFADKKQDCAVALNAARQTVVLKLPVLVGTVVDAVPESIVFQADTYGTAAARVGNQIVCSGKVFEITETTPLYRGEAVSFYRCRVQEVPENAQVPMLRGVGQQL